MITVDVTRFPVVVWRATGTMDAADVAALNAEQVKILDRGERYAMVFDAMDLKGIAAGELRTLARHAKQHEARVAKLTVILALATQSPLIRGALKAYLWIQPLAHPYRICASADEAIREAERAMAADSRADTRAE